MLVSSLGVNNNQGPVTPSSYTVGGMALVLIGLVSKAYFDGIQRMQVVGNCLIVTGGVMTEK